MRAVRRGTDEDRDAIHRVHVESIRGLGRTHYDDEQIEAWATSPTPEGYDLSDDREPFFVASRGDTLTGFAQIDLDREHLEKLYVHPAAERTGVGTALVDRAESVALEEGVSTVSLVASLNAVLFYERVGYEGRDATVKTLRTTTGESVAFPCLEMEKRLID